MTTRPAGIPAGERPQGYSIPTGPSVSRPSNLAPQDKILAPRKQIALAGQTWTARSTTMGDLAEFEGFLRGMNAANFLDLAAQRDMPAEAVAATLDKIYNAPWTPEQKLAHAQGVIGIQFFLWKALSAKGCHEELTLFDVGEMIPDDDLVHALEALESLRQSGEPGASEGEGKDESEGEGSGPLATDEEQPEEVKEST